MEAGGRKDDTEGHREALGGGGCVYRLGWAHGFESADLRQNSPKLTLKYVPKTLCLFGHNRAVKENEDNFQHGMISAARGKLRKGTGEALGG